MGGERLIRFFDIMIALGALVFLAPLMIATWAAITLEDGGPTFFGHRRVGRGGRRFSCLKFRSMRTDAGACLKALLDSDSAARAEWEADHKLKNDPRITRIGRFIRSWSIDELPQLFNVLRGDMSIVGPRPIVEEEIVRYGRHYRDYLRVTPGITGMWQVFGRNDVSYQKRVALDVFFARNRSLWLYLTIIFRTVPAVLLKKGSY